MSDNCKYIKENIKQVSNLINENMDLYIEKPEYSLLLNLISLEKQRYDLLVELEKELIKKS